MARRVPEARYPHKIEQNYIRNLVRLFSAAGNRVMNVYDSKISPLLHHYLDELDGDEGELDMIAALLENTVWVQLECEIMDPVEKIIEKHLRLLGQFNAMNMKQQGKIVGIDPTTNETWLDSFMPASIKENVGYISTIQNELYSNIVKIIFQGARQSLSSADIRNQLVEQISISEHRAALIALNQTMNNLWLSHSRATQADGCQKIICEI